MSRCAQSMLGMLKPWRGQVVFDDDDVTRLSPHEIVALGIRHVPEGRRVFPRMSVLENLEMGAYLHGRAVRAEIERAFSLFPILGERRKQVGGTLSGGEQQMLAIGRALMSHPRLLLLDEPSMGLAPLVVAKIFEIIAEIRRSGTTILVAEQNAAQALQLADRAYVLETGELVMSGPARELLHDEGIRAAYLGEGAA